MIVVALGAVGVALLWDAARAYLPFFADDGFISLRYAERFAHGLGLTWTAGERVEGYSNLTWVLLTALVGRLLGDYVAAARVVGGVSMALAAVAVLGYRGARAGREVAAGLVGMATLVLTPTIAVWTIGGLEQPLVAACLALALGPILAGAAEAPGRRRRVASAAFAFLVLTRPDGIFLVSLAMLALLLDVIVSPARRPRLRQLLWFVIPALVLWLGQLIFRRFYYDDWLPNPAYAKLAFTKERVLQGFHYVGSAASAMPILVIATTVGFVLLFTKGRRRVAVVLMVHVGWALYVGFIGGDIFPARRHAVPLVITSALLVAEGVWCALAAPGAPVLALAAGLACGGALALGTKPDAEIARAHEERWEWVAEPIGLLLRRSFAARDPLLAVDPAGCMPFFTRFRAVDMLGLNDRYLAHHRPRDFGQGTLAHELGDGAYVFARQPDLVLFCLPWGSAGACFRGGKELLTQQGFADAYGLVELEAREPRTERSLFWFRREGRLGVTREPGRVEIPGWLWAAPGGAPIRPGSSGELEAEVTADHPRVFGALELPAGHWRAEVIGAGGLLVRTDVVGEPRREGPLPAIAEINLSAEAKVDLTVSLIDPAPNATSATLRAVMLREDGASGARDITPAAALRPEP